MKIIQLQIYLFVWSQVTESLTNTAVTLGADVIISCDLDIKDIYWFRQKSPDPPELILRTYSSRTGGADYENIIFKLKYSVKTNSSLFIRNITADELGVYYCVKTSEPQKFSNGTKIYISDSVYRNQTALEQEIQWRNLTITSVLFNVLLIIAFIGLLKCCLDASRRSKNTSEKPQSTTAAQYTNDPQYADIDYSKPSRRHRPRPVPEQDQTTYSLLQPVKTV
ncbi:uncharacterized protein LOC127942637 [Carassius gibelio]|uniref:uncharacterized protein LOC127942637 n=1 Tax=Carassius gibelio TaxID=101364 RepID=UPI002278A01E|nr:uncharacterized protein LOC127942637 [Carassius gibelio]